MPFSSEEGKLLFRDWFTTFKPKRILDVGPGAGRYAEIIREIEAKSVFAAAERAFNGRVSWGDVTEMLDNPVIIDAVEIFEPYIDQFQLGKKYDHIATEDISDPEVLKDLDNYDLIILGDVLERLEKSKATKVWKALKKKAKFLWLSIPVISVFNRPWFKGYQQSVEEYSINVHEQQLGKWTFEEVIETLGPFFWTAPFRIISIFIAEGDRK